MNANERIAAAAAAGAALVKPVGAIEVFGAPRARFDATCYEANPAHRADYLYLIGNAMALVASVKKPVTSEISAL